MTHPTRRRGAARALSSAGQAGAAGSGRRATAGRPDRAARRRPCHAGAPGLDPGPGL